MLASQQMHFYTCSHWMYVSAHVCQVILALLSTPPCALCLHHCLCRPQNLGKHQYGSDSVDESTYRPSASVETRQERFAKVSSWLHATHAKVCCSSGCLAVFM